MLYGHTLGAFSHDQSLASVSICGDTLKTGLLLLDGEKVDDGQLRLAAFDTEIDSDESVRVVIWQRPYQDRIDHREDGGVDADTKYLERNQNPEPVAYGAFAQSPSSTVMLVVRTRESPDTMMAAARAVISNLDDELPISRIATMEHWISQNVATSRFYMLLLSLFAAVALSLATVGIYGSLSYAVGQRTHEIGIRMALGSGAVNILRLILGRGIVLTLIGLSVGLAIALALTRVLDASLFGITPTDPPTFAAICCLVVSVSTAASYVPARRASRVDPMVALRHE